MGIDGEEQMKVPVNERAECSGTTVEIKIKILDSQTFSLRVDKCVPVPELKRQIASLTGVLIEQQHLICRGRVLKDDELLSAYHVEDGHTLHLVVRQPISPFPITPADAGESGTQSNSSHQSGPGTLIGTFNVVEDGDGDGDGAFPDLNRIVSAVFDSVGFTRYGSGGEGADLQSSPLELLSIASRRSPSDQTASVTLPIEPPTVPDSLSTLSLYLGHLTQEFLVHGMTAHAAPPVNAGLGLGGVLNPSESRIPLSPEFLSEVILSTRELLVGQASECLQQLAGQLESQSTITDHLERSRIQSRAVRSGVLFQNLGALLLELGRAIMTLRMGRTPADALVNAGPPFIISATGPNQIMVQSLPLQVGGAAGSPPLGVVQNGNASPPALSSSGFPPRHIDIRIRTGAFMPHPEQVGVFSETGQQDDASNSTISGYRDSYGRSIPVRSVIARFSSSYGPSGTFHPQFAMPHPVFAGAVNGLRTPQTTEQRDHTGDSTHPDPARENGNSVTSSGYSSLPSGPPNVQGSASQAPNVRGDEQVPSEEHMIHSNADPQATAEAAQGSAAEESAASSSGHDAALLSRMLHHVLPLIANASGTESSFPFVEGTSSGGMQGDERPSPDASSDPPSQPSPKRQKRD